jgi:DNA-binding beta-propeller fold protein YncE
VTDTTLGAVLVYSIRPQLELLRRYRLAGSPYATAYDPGRNRLWIAQTATNTLAELSAGRRPRLLRSFPTVRAARAVAVDAGSGRVSVTGADGVQLLDPPAVPRTR